MMRRILGFLALAGTVVLVGCGADNGVTPSPIPTPTTAPTAGPVTIQVNGSVPADVLLSDSTGAPVGATSTDAKGQASFVLQPGAQAMVTVISHEDEKSGSIRIETYPNLEPGDKVLAFGLSTFVQGDSKGAIVVDFTDRPPDGTVAYVLEAAGCNGAGIYPQYGERLQGYVLDVTGTCTLGPGGTVEARLYAVNGDFYILGYSTQPGVAIAPNTKTPVTFPDGWKTDLTPLPITYKNVPAPFKQLNVVLFPLHGDQINGYASFGPTYGVTPGQSDTQTLYYAKTLSDRIGYGLYLAETSSYPSHGVQITYERYPASIPTSVTVDLATELPPLVTDVRKIDGPSAFRPGAAWATSASVASMDVGIASFNWRRGTQFVSWDVYFPTTTASPLILPEIPDYLAYARPTGDDGTFFGGVGFQDISTITGYKAWIADPIGYIPKEDVTYRATSRTP
jgi:hypothetical protein